MGSLLRLLVAEDVAPALTGRSCSTPQPRSCLRRIPRRRVITQGPLADNKRQPGFRRPLLPGNLGFRFVLQTPFDDRVFVHRLQRVSPRASAERAWAEAYEAATIPRLRHARAITVCLNRALKP